MKRSMKILLSVSILMSFITTSLGLTSIAVKSIKLNTTSLNLNVGKTYKLKVFFTPENASNKKVTFLSGNRKIAGVDKNGTIKGIIPGKTVITVVSAANKKAVAKCNVTISRVGPIPKVYFFYSTGTLNATSDSNSTRTSLEAVRKHIIEKTGIEPVPIIPAKGAENEKLNLLLASNENLDLFGRSWLDFYSRGAIQPINQYLEKYGTGIKQMFQKTNFENLWKYMTDKQGNIWGVPQSGFSMGYPIWIRTDWLKKLNLSMPKTIDDLEAILKAFKEKDPTGTGETLPMICDLNGLKMSLAAGFIEGEYGCGNWMDTDGKIKPVELNPGFKDFIVRMADWYKKGYIFKEAFASNRDRYIELLKQNKIGTTAYWCSLISINAPLLKQTVPDSSYEVVYLTGLKGKIQTSLAPNTQGQLLAKKSKNPVEAIKLLNWACEDIDNYMTLYAGKEDLNWRWVDKKDGLVEKLNKDYVGEYLYIACYAQTVQYMFNDPTSKMEFEYLRNHGGLYNKAKPAFDAGVLYDTKVLDQRAPNRGDIERMRSEEIIKFITGARPISEYENFIEGMKKAGLDNLIDAYTELYKTQTGK